MRSVFRPCYAAVLAIAATGCTAGNPIALNNQLQRLGQQQLAMQQEGQELRRRADTLDQDNQELETLLAQAEQRSRLIEDRLAATKEQLTSTTSQLAELRDEKTNLENQAKTLSASTKRRVRATITANSSLARSLPKIEIPGIEVRLDGDVVRIELPAGKLFQPGTAQLKPGAGRLIGLAADEIYRAYPRQIIGVEGHTDSDPIRSAYFSSNHQLSTAQASAVLDYLASHTNVRLNRAFVAGHGPNHPVVSNATEAGKARNRRVELVVYPEVAE